MQRIEGIKEIKLFECVNPYKNKWRVRWDLKEEGELVNYMEEEFLYKPFLDEIKILITNWYNSEIATKIKIGFIWKDIPIWLSSENQFNYKSVYDLSVGEKGKNLPVTFKFGNDESPVYYTFEDINDLKDFYLSMVKHINDTVSEGWKLKDSIKWDDYKVD